MVAYLIALFSIVNIEMAFLLLLPNMLALPGPFVIIFLSPHSKEQFLDNFGPQMDDDSPLSAAKVLLIESQNASKKVSFVMPLHRRYHLKLSPTGSHALSQLDDAARLDIIILNAASMRTSGDRVCTSLRKRVADMPIIHIKSNQHPGEHHMNNSASLVLYMPFTSRKLINRIERFLQNKPGGEIDSGPFHLSGNLLTTQQGEKRLTPKVAALLGIFLRHPNQTVKRRDLMMQVWETDYLGDTRTLDVHIRWLREAIEENPSKPNFLITVRGEGYRLVLADGSQKK
jgi:DNA-binding response OmpR family regulator